MRCVTLANEAQQRGWCSCFVMRDPDDYVINLIRSAGHETRTLKTDTSNCASKRSALAHSGWLPVSQYLDASETRDVVNDFEPDWIAVDHYALDATWHGLIKPHCENIMVIDDLGDRLLDCKILLDQNLGANQKKYDGKVTADCEYFLGPRFALLRQEFQNWRQKSLDRRITGSIEKILVTMGGADPANYSVAVIRELAKSKYAAHCEFTIVVGAAYTHTSELVDFVNSSKLQISVLSNVSNMAEIMAKSDLCVGAAGSTSWERCCLGLPTITLAIAENQKEIAKKLQIGQVAIYSSLADLQTDFELFFDASGKEILNKLIAKAQAVCDGFGSPRILAQLEKINEN